MQTVATLDLTGLLGPLQMIPPGMIFADASPIDSLRTRQTELQASSQTLIDAADAAGRDLDTAELEQIDQNTANAEALGRQITAREKANPAPGTGGQGRRTVPDAVALAPGQGLTAHGGGRPTVPATVRVDARTGGYRHLGEFAACVRASGLGDEGAKLRLINALGMNEASGEDGASLVPAEFRDAIMTIVEGEDSLLGMCDSSTTIRNSVTQNVDETTPWGTGGIGVYWEGEGQGAGATKQPLNPSTLRLNKLFARVDASDELLEDAPQLDSYLRKKAPEVMTSVINLAIVSGNGVGKPLGMMNSGALVTIAAETSQPIDSIMHRNLAAMMGRMYAPCWPRATWLMHSDVWAKLPLISFRDGTTTPVPAFMPPGGISSAPFGTLFGRPIKVLEAMETIGDLGDIILADMSAYRAVTKASGVRVETSIHLKFDTDETVFRFIFRLAGAPWWSKPITPRDGPNTRSAFVTLASR